MQMPLAPPQRQSPLLLPERNVSLSSIVMTLDEGVPDRGGNEERDFCCNSVINGLIRLGR